MQIQMSRNYVNHSPATSRGAGGPVPRSSEIGNQSGTDRARELLTKKQQLENEMLLIKAGGTDGAAASAEMQKELESALEKITAELQRTKNDSVRRTEGPEPAVSGPKPDTAGPDTDKYLPEVPEKESPGLYRIEKDEDGYTVIFTPFSES